ncbi:small-conductance mechanosensitive channel [Aequorivita sublithincola DSM 14238]|uniref:Small-conductance mechanosensitive channel n=1 Tax=Aequorivita sublithincola (strain DSM 14238 / LMG 21431 / ACAM 643 / 9-3) TaxID=746697 RepID=I3YZA9_AEQSU|nr:mechanosensitive ion channel domain-containing protein [Aequorivita sublithincola]AFL82327.1 small-conductance mechanosensitive channel [Aequorivita sublithincola DSM 14238]
MDKFKELLNLVVFQWGDHKILVSNFITVLLIIIVTKLVLWLIRKTLFKVYNSQRVDHGTTYAVYQIISYIFWVISFTLILDAFGVKLTLLLAGSAALLVGIGLGLQQTFNDVVSGIILLSERSIKVGDVLEIDNEIVKIQTIGVRTSKGLDRNDISIIIPNSLITTNKVINWSHQSKKTRFSITVGVAYGSDVDKVIRLLEECAIDHPDIYEGEHLEGRLVGFGASSLDFKLLFYSRDSFRIEKMKSDIRIIVYKKFTENDIVISFPQLDLHIK